MIEWILSSSVIMLIVICLRGILQGRISPKLQYALWAVVLVRLLVPVSLFQSDYSVMNILSQDTVSRVEIQMDAPIFEARPQSPRPDFQIPEHKIPVQVGNVQNPQTNISNAPQNPIVNENPGDVSPNSNPQNNQTAQTPPAESAISKITTSLSWRHVLALVWAAGTAIMASVLLWANLSLDKRLKKNRRRTRVTRKLPSYVTDQVATPCLFGLKRPVIYLTAETEDEKTMAHVLAHELTHYKHKDHIWSALRCICLCLHWYNPLAWICASLSKKDAELACDEATIRSLGEDQRISYGETLIRMTCAKRESRDLLLTATTMSLGKRTLKDRIRMIAKNPRTAAITMVIVLLVMTVAVGCTYSGSVNTSKDDSTAEELYNYQHEYLYDENNQPYSVITCTDSEGNVIWMHETEHSDPDGKLFPYGTQKIGRFGENYCYTNNHEIVALNAKTGEIAWINEDIGNSYYLGNIVNHYAIDPNGILWFTPAYYPCVYAISPTGETLNTFDTDYYYCCDLYYDNESIHLGLSHNPSTDTPDTILTIPIDSRGHFSYNTDDLVQDVIISPEQDENISTGNEELSDSSREIDMSVFEIGMSEEVFLKKAEEIGLKDESLGLNQNNDPIYYFLDSNIIFTISEKARTLRNIWVSQIGISTNEGLRVGDSLERMIEIYGTDYQMDEEYPSWFYYTVGENLLSIRIADGYVASWTLDMELPIEERIATNFTLGMSEEDFLKKAEEIGLGLNDKAISAEHNLYDYTARSYDVSFYFSDTLEIIECGDQFVPTSDGLYIGDSFEIMYEIYGAPDHADTDRELYGYYIGSNHLTVFIDDGYVCYWTLDKELPVEERIATSFTLGMYETDFLIMAEEIGLELEYVAETQNNDLIYNVVGHDVVFLISYTDRMVCRISVSEMGIPTAEGLQVGDSFERMIKIYGTDYQKDGEDSTYYDYRIGDNKLSIWFSEGRVDSWIMIDMSNEERIATSFTLGMSETDFLAMAKDIYLGLEDKVFQEANCHETYRTSDYELYYNFYDGKLVEFWTFDVLIPTAEGLCVGDSIDRMIEIYGTNYKKDVEDYSVYQYHIDDYYVDFFYEDGVITSWAISAYVNMNND